ncbi:MAG: hypothetical protein AB7P33_13375 [Dehalococcoidia bacterium]
MKRHLIKLLLCTVVTVSFAAVPSFAWWFLIANDTAEASTVSIDIPAGTAEQIAAGAQPPSLPKNLELRSGDRLLLRNLDTATHQLGSVTIPAGDVKLVPAALFVAAGQNRFLCTFHSAGTISLSSAEDSSLINALFVTLLAGIPLGLAVFAVTTVADRLDDDDAAPLSAIRAR